MIDDLEIVGSSATADCLEALVLTSARSTYAVDELLTFAQEQLGIGITQASFALTMMRKRQQQVGVNYPLIVDDIAVRRTPGSEAMTYASLLHLTPASVARQAVFKSSTTEMEILFERLVAEATARMWGERGRSLRFGWPSDEGRPQDFALAIDWLASRMNIEPGRGYRPLTRKDGGVDVIAWLEFPDHRPGVPLLLVQCTLQADIKSKASDVETRVWGSWLAMDIDPMTALAVPQTINDKTVWNQMSVRTMVLDRLRLVSLLRSPVETNTDWTDLAHASVRALFEAHS